MYCKYCGKEVDKDAVICPGCGKLTDKGSQVMKPVSALPVSNVQPKAQKKESLSKSTILAIVAFSCYIFGLFLNTVITTANSIDILGSRYPTDIDQTGILIVSGIFSVLTIAMGITSFIISFIEKESAYSRIFPTCMMLIGIYYFVEFICTIALYAATMA